MIEAFREGKDIYAHIASAAFGVPYENCLEFHPVTHEYQPDGKARRSEAKTILLGVTYGRSIPSIADQLYGDREDMTDDEKIKGAQKVYDAVMASFSGLRELMLDSQEFARRYGYVETMLGRRRHIPDMRLPEFEFKAMPGYVNPDIDPMDVSTLVNKAEIPERIVDQLQKEFSGYKYYGQIARRTKELYEQKIKVINNRSKINDATRQCVNCVDLDTQILTVAGWKHYYEVSEGDRIISFSAESGNLVEDTIQRVIVEYRPTDVYTIRNKDLYAVATPNHRWVSLCNSDIMIQDTDSLRRAPRKQRNILRSFGMLHKISDDYDYDEDDFTLTGYILGDGNILSKYGEAGIEVVFPESAGESDIAVERIHLERILSAKHIPYRVIRNPMNEDVTVELLPCEFVSEFVQKFPNRVLTPNYIMSLSTDQRYDICIAMESVSYLQFDKSGYYVYFQKKSAADNFQMLRILMGAPTTVEYAEKISGSRYRYAYKVRISEDKTVKLSRFDFHKGATLGVWCVTTGTGTWIARNHGYATITGNSRVQGSAADMTKLAMLNLSNSKEFKELGARLLVPIHDELLIEVPAHNYEQASKLLSDLMQKAGDFLPFDIYCDVEVTNRWYGLEYPCPYTKPESLLNLTQDTVKWIQYMLVECEYILPVYKDENGDKPKGDAAHGVNGVKSDELEAAIDDYCKKYGISRDNFLDHIESKVLYGI